MKTRSYMPKTVWGIVLSSIILSEIIYGIFHFTFNIEEWYIGFGLAFLIPLIVSYFVGGWIVRLNAELTQTKAELENTNSKLALQNANNLKMFTLVAHDVRSPLAYTSGTLDLLKDISIDAEEKAIIKKLQTQFETTLLTVDQLLLWAKANFNQIELNQKTHELQKLIDLELKAKKAEINNKNIELILNYNTPIKISVDQNSFSIIFRNIISNAIKFSAEYQKIEIETYKQQDSAMLTIKDYGKGMSTKKAETLFTNHNIESEFGTNNEVGFGLGLKLVKSHIDLNKANISVKSAPNNGSIFTIAFQLAN
ncbi:MAG: sensor histidine kinase [Bacteroidia bacterium]